MLDIFILVSTSLPPHPSISLSINEVQSIATSNVDGVTPNSLLQQMYGRHVLDEDVDLELELSDEELELVVGQAPTAESCVISGDENGCHSDVFYTGEPKPRIDYDSFLAFQAQHPDEREQIDYICNAFQDKLNCDRRSNDWNVVAAEIWQQLRDPTAVLVKRAHHGFNVDLSNGKLTYSQ